VWDVPCDANQLNNQNIFIGGPCKCIYTQACAICTVDCKSDTGDSWGEEVGAEVCQDVYVVVLGVVTRSSPDSIGPAVYCKCKPPMTPTISILGCDNKDSFWYDIECPEWVKW